MTAPDFEGQHAEQQHDLLRPTLTRLRAILLQERRILIFLILYALAIGFFWLIIPLTVQELVNTFAFAIQPIMVVTLAAIMAAVLLFVGAFRILQFYAGEMLERRLFVRVALALASYLLRFRPDSFRPEHATRFFETVLMQRALSSLLVDFINVLVGGTIGMVLLVFYHPAFLVFDFFLIVAVFVIAFLGRGGLRATLEMSEAKYDVFHWFQEVTSNLLHFKATRCAPLVLRKADMLSAFYIDARKARFRVLVRQYAGSLLLQVMIHTGLLTMAGWLVAIGQLTIGQLVGAEVIIATLIVSLESVVKRTYVIFYFFTALVELDRLFSLPKDRQPVVRIASQPVSSRRGLKVTCRRVSLSLDGAALLQNAHFEIGAGEKWGIVCESETVCHMLSRALAGIEVPAAGVIRYDEVDLRDLGPDTVNASRGLVVNWQISLFEGTLEDNITMGREGILAEDILWALRLVNLLEDVEQLPHGLGTPVGLGGKSFTPSQKLRILLARAIVTRPPLVILGGALEEISSRVREAILRHLCSPDQPWSVLIVTTHPEIKKMLQYCIEVR
ncbi:ATP-binding cassette domain-containing protein [Nitrococcus mobilis]|uniref:HlyB/MsbA family ABC transporter n=1 Tax=Nitrococcus mobilis Nb-231 TaxID=314278 RepID=A4BN10_9GAMM|nr:ABC transporter ATP-binding protein [Nitrococcus mobilis]EAR22609.1 HlyB/MsbA family ABC transporter [Nitrococcus mobilis Nb-231]